MIISSRPSFARFICLFPGDLQSDHRGSHEGGGALAIKLSLIKKSSAVCFLVYIEMLYYGWSLRQAKLFKFARIHHASRDQIRPMGPSSNNVLVQPEIAPTLHICICLGH